MIKIKLDNWSRNRRYTNKQHIEEITKKLLLYYSDPNKKERTKEKYLCKYCYYFNTSKIGGSAITTTNCANCGKEMVFSNTCTDILCEECAKDLKRCKHCSQEID